ncbi:hypothetical protein [Salmonella phage SSBI34]|nr:hypothetical protein [Salmonella phage SSBI34]
MKRLYLKSDFSDRDDHPKAGHVFKVLDTEYDDNGFEYCYHCQSETDGKLYTLYPDEIEEYIGE